MQNIEPFYNWRHIYTSEEDERSPFLGGAILNLSFHRQFIIIISIRSGMILAAAHYLKVLIADYEEKYAVIEMIGEWNDAIENDIMELKREVLEKFMKEGIFKFILIGENVLNFHSDIRDYYEELYEEVTEENGWVVCLNMPEQTQYDFKHARLNRYVELMELENWRTYKPYHLFKKIDNELMARLTL